MSYSRINLAYVFWSIFAAAFFAAAFFVMVFVMVSPFFVVNNPQYELLAEGLLVQVLADHLYPVP